MCFKCTHYTRIASSAPSFKEIVTKNHHLLTFMLFQIQITFFPCETKKENGWSFPCSYNKFGLKPLNLEKGRPSTIKVHAIFQVFWSQWQLWGRIRLKFKSWKHVQIVHERINHYFESDVYIESVDRVQNASLIDLIVKHNDLDLKSLTAHCGKDFKVIVGFRKTWNKAHTSYDLGLGYFYGASQTTLVPLHEKSDNHDL